MATVTEELIALNTRVAQLLAGVQISRNFLDSVAPNALQVAEDAEQVAADRLIIEAAEAVVTASEQVVLAAEASAIAARDHALTAAEISSDVRFFATYEEASAQLLSLPANQIVRILKDGTKENRQSFYRKETGVLVWKSFDFIYETPVTEEKAVNGLDNVGKMSSLRTRQAIDARIPGIRPEDFGNLSSDDSLLIQQANDMAETMGVPLILTPGKIYHVRGTIYLGNIDIRSKGAVIDVTIAADFVQRGTASEKDKGAILTKAAPGADYGYNTVTINFDELVIVGRRTTDTGTVHALMVMQNTERFAGNKLFGQITGTGNTEAVSIDFRDGVQGIEVPRIQSRVYNGLATGGMWLRNRSSARRCAYNRIGEVEAWGQSRDEPFAIFTSGDANADISDLWIGKVSIRALAGGGGQGMSVFKNVGTYDPTKMRNIEIGPVTVEVEGIGPVSPATGGFGVKTDRCAPTIGPVKVSYTGAWNAAQTTIFGVRVVDRSSEGQKKHTYFPSVEVEVVHANAQPSGSAAAMYGPGTVGFLRVFGAGSGLKVGANYVNKIIDCDIDLPSLTLAADFCNSISGRVVGPISNTPVFRGNHILDTDAYPAGVWFTISSALSPEFIEYVANCVLRGAGAGGRIFVAQANPAWSVPVRLEYTLANPLGKSLSPDTLSNKCFFKHYVALMIVGTTTTDRTVETLTVTANSATPKSSRHLVASGAVVNTLIASFDGQVVELRASSGSFTLAHSVGNVYSPTGANVTVGSIGWLRLHYFASVSRWEVQQ